MTFSGISGGNCIMSSIAKVRVEAGIIEGAEVVQSSENYIVQFTGDGAIWGGKNLVLSSARQPYEARIFKSIDGAISAIEKIGFKQALVKVD